MHQLAPWAIRAGFRFTCRVQNALAHVGLVVVETFELRLMLVTPAHGQDFLERAAPRVTAGAVRRGEVRGAVEFGHGRRPRIPPAGSATPATLGNYSQVET